MNITGCGPTPPCPQKKCQAQTPRSQGPGASPQVCPENCRPSSPHLACSNLGVPSRSKPRGFTFTAQGCPTPHWNVLSGQEGKGGAN